MVSATLLLPVSISERSEKNTSCLMLSAARSPLIIVHHHGDRLGAHDRQPRAFRHRLELVAVLGGERLPDRHEIVAGIEPFRNLADVLAERLAVAQECRAREHVDLRAGVVDVIFARDVVAGEMQAGSHSASPNTAPRQWPTCIGPVGLAETYSTLTFAPSPIALLP